MLRGRGEGPHSRWTDEGFQVESGSSAELKSGR